MWPADTNAERIVTHPCVYQCGNIFGTNATRTCLGNGSWTPTNFTSCPTERTCQLVNLTEVQIDAYVEVKYKENVIVCMPYIEHIAGGYFCWHYSEYCQSEWN